MAEIGRFQIMAVLQAARAAVLGFDLRTARSWGLNRAIFYALARKGYLQKKRAKATAARKRGEPASRHPPFYSIGGEKAYLSEADTDAEGVPMFMIGGKTQWPSQFERQVARRFDDFSSIWHEALAIVGAAEPWQLDNASRFYNNVYKPRRDALIERWSRSGAPPVRRRPELRVLQGGRRGPKASRAKRAA